jgi:anti-anti-sigma factor
MTECAIEDRNGYYQIVNFNLDAESFPNIFSKIESAIKSKRQDIILSLESVGVLYSSHLAILVRIHQMLHKHGLRFGLLDISLEIKNLLQITQLDSIFSIFESLDDFKNSLKSEDSKQPELNFEWQIVKKEKNSANVICKGNMHAGEQLNELQKSILDSSSIAFDFSSLQNLDSAAMDFLDKFSGKCSISITGANEELARQFQEKLPKINICRA